MMNACQRENCKNPGVWSANIRFWAEGHRIGSDPIEVPFPMLICAYHKQFLGINDFITEAGFALLNRTVQKVGGYPIDRNSAEIAWIARPQGRAN